jgi:hypothetical protein
MAMAMFADPDTISSMGLATSGTGDFEAEVWEF